MDTCPGVPPVAARLNKMTLDVVTAVELTAIAPGLPLIAPLTPREALLPVVMDSLLPAVPSTKFPFVAVMFPSVPVMVVAAVTDPEKEGDPLKAGSAPVDPIKAWPVDATPSEDTALDAPAMRTPCCVTALALTAEVPFPVSTPVSVAAPDPSSATGRGMMPTAD